MKPTIPCDFGACHYAATVRVEIKLRDSVWRRDVCDRCAEWCETIYKFDFIRILPNANTEETEQSK